MFEMSLQYVMLSARLQGNPHIAHHVFVDMYVSVDDVFNNPLHSLPSDDCRAVLVQLIKLACSKISVPTIYIHNWGARVVQVAFYFLGFFRNISQQKCSLTRRNNFNADQAGKFLLDAFFACHYSEQDQEQIIKFVMDHAIQNQEAITDYACQHGYSPLQVDNEDIGIGARNNSRNSFPNTSRTVASPQAT